MLMLNLSILLTSRGGSDSKQSLEPRCHGCRHKTLLIYKTFLFLMGNKNFFNLRQITVKTGLE